MSNSYRYVRGTLAVSENGTYAYLPHSCDEWMIGSKEAALELVGDLQEFIDGVYLGQERTAVSKAFDAGEEG